MTVLDFLVRGYDCHEIAERMGVTPSCVHQMADNLRKLAGARTTMQLVAIAVRSGWVR